jgi:hypothetical protein
MVFDHPLAKVFMRYGGGVINAEGLRKGHLMWAGGGDDAIDHRIGEATGGVDPVGQGRVGQTRESYDSLPQNRAIALQVVAAQTGERASPLRPP